MYSIFVAKKRTQLNLVSLIITHLQNTKQHFYHLILTGLANVFFLSIFEKIVILGSEIIQ